MRKNIIILMGVAFVCIASITGCFQSHKNENDLQKPTAEVIAEARKYFDLSDKYQSEQRFDLAAEAHNKAVTIAGKKIVGEFLRDRHTREIKAIDEAADYEAQGARYYRMKLYERAAEAYQKAYEIGGGGRAVSGPSLARTLEMLGRLDEAIDVSNRMIQNQAVNEFGIIMAQVHIARLMAIKEGRPVPNYSDPTNPIPPHDIAAYILPEDPVYAEAEAKLKKYNDKVHAMTAKMFKL